MVSASSSWLVFLSWLSSVLCCDLRPFSSTSWVFGHCFSTATNLNTAHFSLPSAAVTLVQMPLPLCCNQCACCFQSSWTFILCLRVCVYGTEIFFFVFVIWVILVFKQFSQKRISKEVGGFGRCCKDKSQGSRQLVCFPQRYRGAKQEFDCISWLLILLTTGGKASVLSLC